MTNNIFYDKNFRQKIRDLDKGLLTKLIADYTTDVEVKVFVNTEDTTYFIIPASPALGQLGDIQAAGFNTMGTGGTASSYSTICSTTSTVGTASSLGCAQV